jgi:hypothetical protein
MGNRPTTPQQLRVAEAKRRLAGPSNQTALEGYTGDRFATLDKVALFWATFDFPNREKILPEAARAFYAYAQDYYTVINPQLRGTATPFHRSVEIAGMGRAMVRWFVRGDYCSRDRLLAAAGAGADGIVVYRGLKLDERTFEVGKVLKNDAFVSTSWDVETAMTFAGAECCLLALSVPANTPMALPYAFSSEGTVEHVAPEAVGEFGYFQGSGEAGEIILPPGTRYRIDKATIGVYSGKRCRMYEAQVLPYDPKELRKAHGRLMVVETEVGATKAKRKAVPINTLEETKREVLNFTTGSHLRSRTTDSNFDLDDLYARIRTRNPHFSTTHCAHVALDGKFVFHHAMVAHGCIMPNCEEIIALGGPMCAAHTAEVYNVTIRQTTLVDADTSHRYKFAGLFAERGFKENEQIVPMLVAERIGVDHLHIATPALDPYRINGTESGLLYRSIGMSANTQLREGVFNDGITPPYRRTHKARCNAMFRDMILVAHRDIVEGEEIFVNYEGMRPRREFIGLSVTTVCH